MRLSFDARARAVLRRVPRVNVYSGLELVLLAALAAQSARLVWAIVTPIAPLGAWQPAQIATPADPAGLFGSFDPFFRLSGQQPAQAGSVTSLQLTLFGTRIDGASGGGSAIVAGPDGVQRSVAVGEEIAPGVTLKLVAFDHVTLDRGGAAEDLFLDQSGGGTSAPATGGEAPAGPSGGPPPGELTAQQLRSDIGAVPRIEGGRLNGLTVRSQGSGTAFRAAGLQDGDVVTAIGGRPVSGAGDLERLGRMAGSLQLTVERDGRAVPISVETGR